MATVSVQRTKPVEPCIESVTVVLSVVEAKSLVALGGHIGGSVDGPRGDVCGVLHGIGEVFYPSSYDDWAQAQTDLGIRVSGGLGIARIVA